MFLISTGKKVGSNALYWEKEVRSRGKKLHSYIVLGTVSLHEPRTENIHCPYIHDVLTGLEWAETVLAADGDRETTGLIS